FGRQRYFVHAVDLVLDGRRLGVAVHLQRQTRCADGVGLLPETVVSIEEGTRAVWRLYDHFLASIDPQIINQGDLKWLVSDILELGRAGEKRFVAFELIGDSDLRLAIASGSRQHN